MIDGKKANIPSQLVKAGQMIALNPSSKEIPIIKENMEVAGSKSIPEWLEVNSEKMEGKVLSLPTREQIDVPVNEQLVVEFYAR
jgi:small subunit ribosomal protein S4